MIKFENTITPSPEQWRAIINGTRNPMNSWDKSDSTPSRIGDADKELMLNRVKAGSDHSKFMRMITVYVDVTAPLYWWKEYDTYKIGTVANSCSTMHKIHSKPFSIDDFSNEHLSERGYASLLRTINDLEYARYKFNETKKKKYWHDIIQLLPTSYNQKRTLMLNYAVLRNIYHSRKHHKLDEWREFTRWIDALPHSDLITIL